MKKSKKYADKLFVYLALNTNKETFIESISFVLFCGDKNTKSNMIRKR